MSSEMSANSNNTEDFLKEVLIDIGKITEPAEPTSDCCIYKVPKKLRKLNEEAYTPQLISIGPLHHNKGVELSKMEKHKKRFMKSLFEKLEREKQIQILTFIKENEEKIRDCYAETSEIQSSEFVKMILYDSIFIIELFQRTKLQADKYKSDRLLVVPAVRYGLYMDLELLENQLPLFVLENIYNIACSDINGIPTFKELSQIYFRSFGTYNNLPSQVAVEHFTDWRRKALLGSYPESVEPRNMGYIKDLPCAVKLHESGVQFKRVEGKFLLDIKFLKRRQRIPCFNVDELQIPRLEVFSSTEQLFRNIIALEKCHYPTETYFGHYMELLDCLIDTEEDVDLLVGQGIISNHLGDNASLANMFNKLGQNVHLSKSCYYQTCQELKEHYNNPWNRKKATLKRVYFNNLWRGTATVAAIVLLLLTVVQAICSMLQIV